MRPVMKLSKINIDQLACTRIILRNVEPKLDGLYTLYWSLPIVRDMFACHKT
jgi:hypothetical protein